MRHASGWRSATCAPRRAGSRGVATSKPSGASHASASWMASVVSARPLAAMGAIPASPTSPTAASTAAMPRIGGVPAANRSIPSAGRVRRPHGELLALPEPAANRGAHGLGKASAHVEPCRRAGAGVEVLVRAADRQLGRRQVDLHRPRRMAQVPDHAGVAGFRQARHVQQLAGPIVDEREAHHARIGHADRVPGVRPPPRTAGRAPRRCLPARSGRSGSWPASVTMAPSARSSAAWRACTG